MPVPVQAVASSVQDFCCTQESCGWISLSEMNVNLSEAIKWIFPGSEQWNKNRVWNPVSRDDFRKTKREVRRRVLSAVVNKDEVSLSSLPWPPPSPPQHTAHISSCTYKWVSALSRGLEESMLLLTYQQMGVWGGTLLRPLRAYGLSYQRWWQFCVRIQGRHVENNSCNLRNGKCTVCRLLW